MKSALTQAVENLKVLRERKMVSDGEKIKRARASADMTQVSFSAICGVKQCHLANMEAGRRSVPAEVWERIKIWKSNR